MIQIFNQILHQFLKKDIYLARLQKKKSTDKSVKNYYIGFTQVMKKGFIRMLVP